MAFRNAPENWVALFQNISNLNQNPPFSKHILNFGSRCQVWVEAMFCVHIISQQKKKKKCSCTLPQGQWLNHGKLGRWDSYHRGSLAGTGTKREGLCFSLWRRNSKEERKGNGISYHTHQPLTNKHRHTTKRRTHRQTPSGRLLQHHPHVLLSLQIKWSKHQEEACDKTSHGKPTWKRNQC